VATVEDGGREIVTKPIKEGNKKTGCEKEKKVRKAPAFRRGIFATSGTSHQRNKENWGKTREKDIHSGRGGVPTQKKN